MNHFINVISLDEQTMYLHGGQVVCFSRHASGNTIIQLSTGAAIFVKTPPEQIELRMNTYLNNLLLAINSKKGGSDGIAH